MSSSSFRTGRLDFAKSPFQCGDIQCERDVIACIPMYSTLRAQAFKKIEYSAQSGELRQGQARQEKHCHTARVLSPNTHSEARAKDSRWRWREASQTSSNVFIISFCDTADVCTQPLTYVSWRPMHLRRSEGGKIAEERDAIVLRAPRQSYSHAQKAVTKARRWQFQLVGIVEARLGVHVQQALCL